ncbi:fimbrial protein [Enterobacter sp.]|uniref:fimbrial protein n=1 Tax=Enterobacter sp. TaxID=42895 RepID=UPI0028B00289|nr:fimbrial protein [Enterobacter sp.]
MLFRYFFATLFILTIPCHAKIASHGKVNMQGSILESACSININSQYQDILLKTIPVGELLHNNNGPMTPLDIKLVNCSNLPGEYRFRVTFYGDNAGDGRFGFTGSAEGVSLRISTIQGEEAVPGIPMTESQLQGGTNVLRYQLRLTGNGQDLKAGTYQTLLRMNLEYY